MALKQKNIYGFKISREIMILCEEEKKTFVTDFFFVFNNKLICLIAIFFSSIYVLFEKCEIDTHVGGDFRGGHVQVDLLTRGRCVRAQPRKSSIFGGKNNTIYGI